MSRIPVIDDDLKVLQMTRLMPEQDGFEVLATPHGADGIVKTRQPQPDLVLPVGALQITVMTMPALQGAGIPTEQVHVVFHYATGPVTSSPQAIDWALSHPPALTIPFDSYQVTAPVQGAPLILSRASGPTAGAVRRLVGQIVSAVRPV